jgi:hypothetical protein
VFHSGPDNPTIVGQDPVPGTEANRWGSLRVWVRSASEAARKPAVPPPQEDPGHATPDGPVELVDLASPESRQQ